MIRLKNSKFELLFEDVYNRFQSGGLVSGDVVKFRKGTMTSAFVKNAEPAFKQMIKDLMESDLNLKVGAVRMIRAGTQFMGAESGTGTGDGGATKASGSSSFGYSVDVVQEYAPGLWKNPITVPIELLERVADTGSNMNPVPVPDSWRRKDTTQIKPVEASKYKNRLETKK